MAQLHFEQSKQAVQAAALLNLFQRTKKNELFIQNNIFYK
jgi:hypothetical protein